MTTLSVQIVFESWEWRTFESKYGKWNKGNSYESNLH